MLFCKAVSQDFPTPLPLNGADYFLHALDRIMRQKLGRGNRCHFVISLEHGLELEQVAKIVADVPHLSTLSNLTTYRAPLPGARPVWRHTNQSVEAITVVEPSPLPDQLPDAIASQCTDRDAPPISLNLVPDSDTQPCQIIFSWDHSLMDAHGSELLCSVLAGLVQPADVTWYATPSHKPLNLERLQKLKDIKEVLFTACEPPFASTRRTFTHAPQPPRYHVISFSNEETIRIDETCQQVGARFNRSAFYLVASARAFCKHLLQPSDQKGDVVVPVPQDRRKRGSQGPVLSNQVTFIFYRLQASLLSDMEASVSSVSEQMMSMMRQDRLESYASMMEIGRRIPLWLYKRTLLGPSKGNLASFNFSDTGESLRDFTTFQGLPVRNAVHYPPNAFPPGVTIIFSRCQGRLNVTLTYLQELIQATQVTQFTELLRTDLMADPHTG